MGQACGKQPTTSGGDESVKKTAAGTTAPSQVTNGSPSGMVTGSPGSHKLRQEGVKDAYKFGKVLGVGGFATVKLATERKTGKQYACKIMKLPPEGAIVSPDDFTREDIFKEIDLMLQLQHPNVVYMKEYFVADDKVYLITELLQGGELLDAVLARGQYSEAEARTTFRQLVLGLQYLHSKGIVHRDLKLENLLLANPDDITTVKIADFGLAKNQLTMGTLKTVCGTPQYVAPEVISGRAGTKYGPEVDLWSAGVVLFILLGGYPPFYNENEPQLFRQIRQGAYSFNDPVWATVSSQAKDLIAKLLCVDPTHRLSASEVLKHTWLMEEERITSLPVDQPQKRTPEQLRKLFKKAIHTVMLMNRLERLAVNKKAGVYNSIKYDQANLKAAQDAVQRWTPEVSDKSTD